MILHCKTLMLKGSTSLSLGLNLTKVNDLLCENLTSMNPPRRESSQSRFCALHWMDSVWVNSRWEDFRAHISKLTPPATPTGVTLKLALFTDDVPVYMYCGSADVRANQIIVHALGLPQFGIAYRYSRMVLVVASFVFIVARSVHRQGLLATVHS